MVADREQIGSRRRSALRAPRLSTGDRERLAGQASRPRRRSRAGDRSRTSKSVLPRLANGAPTASGSDPSPPSHPSHPSHPLARVASTGVASGTDQVRSAFPTARIRDRAVSAQRGRGWGRGGDGWGRSGDGVGTGSGRSGTESGRSRCAIHPDPKPSVPRSRAHCRDLIISVPPHGARTTTRSDPEHPHHRSHAALAPEPPPPPAPPR